MEEFKTYDFKVRLGDAGNTEWWTEEDWIKHREYVEELKKAGRYGEEQTVYLTLQHNPLFDDPAIDKLECHYTLAMIDFNRSRMLPAIIYNDKF